MIASLHSEHTRKPNSVASDTEFANFTRDEDDTTVRVSNATVLKTLITKRHYALEDPAMGNLGKRQTCAGKSN